MRAPRLALPLIASAATALLLSGCGGDDDSSTASPSTPSSSSPASSSPAETSADAAGSTDPAVAAFCDQAETFADSASKLQDATPDTVVPILRDTVSAFDAVEPPAEIASDWSVVGDALHAFSDTAGSIDVTTPDGAAAFQQAGEQFLNVFSGPEGTKVSDYVTGNCPGA